MQGKQHYEIILDQYDYSASEGPLAQLKETFEQLTGTLSGDHIQTEIDCLNFTLLDGKVQSLFSTTDASGLTVTEYPSLKTFSQESLEYLTKRIFTTPNTRLKSRYGQILWNSEFKQKGKFVHAAVDAYLELIQIVAEPAKWQHNVFDDVNNLLFLAVKSKYRVDEVKAMVITAITDAQTPYNEFIIFVPRVVALRKYFSKAQLQTVADKAELIWAGANQLSLTLHELIAKRAIEVYNVLQQKSAVWHKRMGECYEQSIELKKDDPTGMIPLKFCETAINYYNAAGEKKKVEELLKIFTTLKANLKLATFSIELTSSDLNKVFKYQHQRAKTMMTLEPDKILTILCGGIDIFPNVATLKDMIAAKDKSMDDLLHVIRYDINKNPSQKKRKLKGDITEDLFDTYDWYIKVVANQFLREVFEQGLIQDRVNFQTLLNYLYKHSWIGKNIVYRTSGGEPYEHNWLVVIAPSLLEFFAQWKTLHYSGNGFRNFILCIDSLTLKFEGMLRDLAKMIGANAVISSKGKIREAFIEDILSNNDVKKFLGEDDLILFRYVFTAAGLNARNNTAHAFYKFHHYTPELMILVIMAVLRIAKYPIRVDKIIL